MAPFTHVSPNRPSGFSDGTYGVLYAGDRFEVALLETIHRYTLFMSQTDQPPGWTSQFREIVIDIGEELHDLRSGHPDYAEARSPMTTARARHSALRCAHLDRTVSSIRAFAARRESVSASSISISPRPHAVPASRLSLGRRTHRPLPRPLERAGLSYRVRSEGWIRNSLREPMAERGFKGQSLWPTPQNLPWSPGEVES